MLLYDITLYNIVYIYIYYHDIYDLYNNVSFIDNGVTWFNHDQKIDNLDFDLRLIQLQESRIGALEGAQQIPRGFQLLLFQLNI